MQYKLKHRLSAALMAGAMCCTMIPAASADEIATPETVDTAVPEVTDSVTPALSQITENLYNDLPDAPTGSYIGSMGLPVATGKTKISISSWVSDLYDGVDAHMDADALSEDETTIIVGKGSDSDYAVVPLLVQTEYPADGATSEIILPDGVELLSYASTDYDLIPADEAEQTKILHQTYAEQSAAATGLYVKTSSDFTAQFIYTAPDGEQLQKSLHVQLSDEAAPTQLYADNGIATLAAGPTPPYATGKITSIAKEGGTWLIWFNGQEAYCCSHGLNGQPKGCPTYSFSHVSRLEPGQYTPGNHYANQVNIWGGLGQLSLDMLDDRPVVASLEDDPEGCEEQPDILGSLYDETQQWIMENYPDSYAAQTYIAAAEELINGTDAQSGENGYYTYIYNPPAGYAWQVVALVGEEIAGGTEIPDVPSVPEPKYYSAAWTAPAQTAGGSFDLTFTVNTDKVQLNTLEKVDGAVITVTPSRTGGSVDGGSWQMSPAGAQTITTGGHTQDDSFHLNGGDGSATWTVHYEVSKTSTSTLSGQEGPFTSQAEADAAAEAAKNAAIGQLQNEAQGMVDAAIVYCAHCGAKMSGFMHTDRYKLADGSIREKVQPKYNCFQRGQRNKGGRDCDGQALYLAERVDAIVLKIVEEVFEQIRDTPYSQVAENRIRQESNLQKTKRAAAEKKIKAAQHALERFEGEILKCLDGTSNFTEDMIAKQIRRYQQELDDAKAKYAELQNARLNEAAEIRKLRTYYDDFKGWAEEFDTAPLEMKRMILSHLIDRVEVGRKYQVIVKFNMKYRQFLECTAETYNTEIGA